MKVLITGGAGFIGSHLAAAWARRGASVTILDNMRTGNPANLDGIPCELVTGSVQDASLVERLCKGVDYVHHMAALVSVPESMSKPEETESINVLGTLNVLNGCRAGGVKKLVYSSTSAVYGLIDRPIHHESDLPDPLSPYAITKLAGEYYLGLYTRAYGVPTVALRYFNVYGPRQDPKSPYAAAVAIFSDKARAGQPLTIYGDGEQTRDFVFVEDVVAANMLAAEKGEGLYNVACGGRITVNDLAREIVGIAGSTSQIVHATERPGDVKHSRGSCDRLKALGWVPSVSLAEGLRRTIGT
ncbi:NAD-dependent epimerase/dehydratase family protein [bacterium]|nr:NAD-dependent epimerase/dehydratase family protein [bacterium]